MENCPNFQKGENNVLESRDKSEYSILDFFMNRFCIDYDLINIFLI